MLYIYYGACYQEYSHICSDYQKHYLFHFWSRNSFNFLYKLTEAYSREQALLIQKIVSEHNGSDFVFVEDSDDKRELWKVLFLNSESLPFIFFCFYLNFLCNLGFYPFCGSFFLFIMYFFVSKIQCISFIRSNNSEACYYLNLL